MPIHQVRIDPLSVTSLYLKVTVNSNPLSTATGVVVQRSGRYFLVTSGHVFSGRHAETGKPLSTTAGVPDQVRIAHHIKNQLGTWRFAGEALLNSDGSPRWLSHPDGPEIDVAALELRNIDTDAQIYPFDLTLAGTDLSAQPAMAVSVIGFPFGLRPNGLFPIWKTGHIATEPDLPYGGRPAFLIDATTKSGMSGSPVIMRAVGAHLTSRGGYSVTGGVAVRFLGIYSGRIHDDADIGCVWNPSVIDELLAQTS